MDGTSRRAHADHYRLVGDPSPRVPITLSQGGLPENYAASVLIQIGSALGYLHTQGIVHRDQRQTRARGSTEEWTARLAASRATLRLCHALIGASSTAVLRAEASAAAELLLLADVASCVCRR